LRFPSKRFLFIPAAIASAAAASLADLIPGPSSGDPPSLQASAASTPVSFSLDDAMALSLGLGDAAQGDNSCQWSGDPLELLEEALAGQPSSCGSELFFRHFLTLLRNDVDFTVPAQGELTSGFGMRWGRHHRGVDIANAIGTPIYAVWDGRVIRASMQGGYGLTVEIEHSDGYITRYAHCNRLLVREGDRVVVGQAVAQMGNTGSSTGPHLHFEVIGADGVAIDPVGKMPLLAELVGS
jgi:murein DD-endopeptidase MepM/ murein hydrolase activator NlpD